MDYNVKIEKPLRVRRREKKEWENLNYCCFVIFGRDAKCISKKILEISNILLPKAEKAYAVLWFLSFGEENYVNDLKGLKLVFRENGCLIYEIKDLSEVEILIEEWGQWQYDSLDMIFQGKEKTLQTATGYQYYVYKSCAKYSKNFIKWIQGSDVIINDSGDGEEVEITVSKEYCAQVEAYLKEITN